MGVGRGLQPGQFQALACCFCVLSSRLCFQVHGGLGLQVHGNGTRHWDQSPGGHHNYGQFDVMRHMHMSSVLHHQFQTLFVFLAVQELWRGLVCCLRHLWYMRCALLSKADIILLDVKVPDVATGLNLKCILPSGL